MKRSLGLSATLGGAVVLVIVMIVGWSVGRGAGYAAVQPAASGSTVGTLTTTPHFYLYIHQGEQLANEPLGPAYLPSSFTLPANTNVTLTISNFDDATPLPDNAAQYAKASGIDKNSFETAPMDPTNPNAKVATTTASQIDAAKVSHTFTIPKLNLNVPIGARSTTTFTFRTPEAGVYDWRCMDPCGIGPVGWGGAMSTDGYMQGKVTFA